MSIFGVTTTGIYCRDGCPSRAAKPQNIRRFKSTTAAREAGFRACKRCNPDGQTRAEDAVRNAIAYIESHLDDKLTLTVLAHAVDMSPTHFQRTFSQSVGVSPKMYAATLRAQRLKAQLRKGKTVLNAAHDAGFADQKSAYAHAHAALGMSPGAYRRGGTGEMLLYTITSTVLGRTLIAVTRRGIAAVAFDKTDDALLVELRREFPNAHIANRSEDAHLRATLDSAMAAVLARLQGRAEDNPRLDIGGTPFERKVWRAIARIPKGRTATYSEIARKLGQPRAARAIARACAANRLAVVIPCHRVVRADGALADYRWGINRKRALLKIEQP